MRRALYVIHYPIFGGPHNQALVLNAPMRRLGWDTSVVVPDEEGNAFARLAEAGVEVFSMPLHRIRAQRDPRFHARYLAGMRDDIRRLRAVIRRTGADVVVVGGLVNPQAPVAAELEGTPIVWQILDTHLPKPGRALLMPFVRWASDVAMSTGHTVAAEHPGALAMGPRLVTYFPPVDVARFSHSDARRLGAREFFGFGPDAIVIGNVANLNPMKGQQWLVEAAVRLKQREPRISVLLLGAQYPHHSAHVDRIVEIAEAGGFTRGEDFVLHDPGSQVHRFIHALDLFCLTSEPRSEGIPTVILEAMAAGLPVVATDVAGVSEAVIEGVTGSIVPPRDTEAITAALETLVASPELRSAYSTAAHARAQTEFDVSVCAATHARAFDRAINSHAGAWARESRGGPAPRAR